MRGERIFFNHSVNQALMVRVNPRNCTPPYGFEHLSMKEKDNFSKEFICLEKGSLEAIKEIQKYLQ